MKIPVIFLSITTLILSCMDHDAIPEVPVNDHFDTTGAILIKKGDLTGINHTASGVVKVFESAGEFIVVLDPYMSQNGPDLKVYLSVDAEASSYINLGKLKSTNGRQSYVVPGQPDVSTYHYVHIWCEKYTVVFARAALSE
jgi:hypothetical protein